MGGLWQSRKEHQAWEGRGNPQGSGEGTVKQQRERKKRKTHPSSTESKPRREGLKRGQSSGIATRKGRQIRPDAGFYQSSWKKSDCKRKDTSQQPCLDERAKEGKSWRGQRRGNVRKGERRQVRERIKRRMER